VLFFAQLNDGTKNNASVATVAKILLFLNLICFGIFLHSRSFLLFINTCVLVCNCDFSCRRIIARPTFPAMQTSVQVQQDLAPHIKAFHSIYQSAPQIAVFSPGRVNLIGEHTDYNLLPVMPMAIGRGILMLIRERSDSTIRATNAKAGFPVVEFTAVAEIPKSAPGHWGNYAKAAIQRLVPLLTRPATGFDAYVYSTLPPAAGLSSSSALVVATYRAFEAVNGLEIPPLEAGELMRQAERYVGTAGGGMDQACIVLGEAGKALKIDFDPLRIEPVPIPAGITFFAINSLEEAQKSGTARFLYNRRVVECKIGLKLLSKGRTDEKQWFSLRDFYDDLATSQKSYSAACIEKIGCETYSFARVNDLLGSEFQELLASKNLEEAHFPQDFGGFKVYSRVMHVLTETDRVLQFMRSMREEDTGEMAKGIAASHASCRDLYNISTPRIEQLVQAALRCGASAARITGAGFGGSIVAMVPDENVPTFSQKLWDDFFATLPETLPGDCTRDSVIIECQPGSGAYCWTLG
jgi:galactokinase